MWGRNYVVFMLDDLANAMIKVKMGKAPGPDMVPAEVYVGMTQEMAEIMMEVMNVCWREGRFPESWKMTKIIIIIRKGGERNWSKPGSYRPVSLLPIIS